MLTKLLLGLLLGSIIMLLTGAGTYLYYPDLYVRMESYLLSLLDQYGNPSSSGEQSSSTVTPPQTETTEGKKTDVSPEDIFAEMPKCVEGNISQFREKVKTEAQQRIETGNKIANIPTPTAITQICSVPLEVINGRIKSIQEIVPGLDNLQKQTKSIEKCFNEMTEWLDRSSRKLPGPPFDVILNNLKIDFDKTKEQWQSEANRLVADDQKAKLEEYLKTYKRLSDAHKVSCPSSPSQTETEPESKPEPTTPISIPATPLPTPIPKECQDPSYRIDHLVECVR